LERCTGAAPPVGWVREWISAGFDTVGSIGWANRLIGAGAAAFEALRRPRTDRRAVRLRAAVGTWPLRRLVEV
jgi:hypothetical protein